MWAELRTKIGATSLAWLLLLAIAPLGCDEAPHDATAIDTPAEASFAEQADSVREGRSDTIRLDRTTVDDRQLAELDGLEDALRRINLSQSTISDDGLARIAGMSKLIQLRLASDQVSDAGMASLKDLTALRHLHLIDAPISDKGLAHLHGLEKLESLYLDGSRVTDTGKEQLLKALPNVHVHFDGGHHRVDPQADDHGQ